MNFNFKCLLNLICCLNYNVFLLIIYFISFPYHNNMMLILFLLTMLFFFTLISSFLGIVFQVPRKMITITASLAAIVGHVILVLHYETGWRYG